MTAADDMNRWADMQFIAAHLEPNGDGLILELAPPGRTSRRFVTIAVDTDILAIEVLTVTETVDPPAPHYRNRRGPTPPPDYETWGQHQIDQGDDRAEQDREQTDWCDL